MPVTDRDHEIWELYSQRGMTQRAIGRKLNISPTAVHNHIRKVEKVGLKHLVETVEQMKLRNTEQLIFVYREAVEGWERSKMDRIIRKQSERQSTMGEGGEELKTDLHIEGQAGDPRFLVAAMGAIQGLRELWGLDAPVDMNMNLSLKVPSHANPQLARARAEAARIIEGQLLSPAEQEIRRLTSGSPAPAGSSTVIDIQPQGQSQPGGPATDPGAAG